jgi:hypothetical protein
MGEKGIGERKKEGGERGRKGGGEGERIRFCFFAPPFSVIAVPIQAP